MAQQEKARPVSKSVLTPVQVSGDFLVVEDTFVSRL